MPHHHPLPHCFCSRPPLSPMPPAPQASTPPSLPHTPAPTTTCYTLPLSLSPYFCLCPAPPHLSSAVPAPLELLLTLSHSSSPPSGLVAVVMAASTQFWGCKCYCLARQAPEPGCALMDGKWQQGGTGIRGISRCHDIQAPHGGQQQARQAPQRSQVRGVVAAGNRGAGMGGGW